MDSSKISSFFITNTEMKNIQKRINMLEIVINEVESNPECVDLSGGNVWKWFKMYMWKPILLENGLSDEGKMDLMRMCVLEKMKYQNMGDKGLNSFIKNRISTMKLEEKKERGKKGGASPVKLVSSSELIESQLTLKAAA